MSKCSVTIQVLFFLLFTTTLYGQVSFEATSNAKQVVKNGYFEVEYTLNNIDGNDFKLPTFKNFKVANGPARSSSTTIINGKVSKKYGYTYTLQALKEGKFTLPAASIRADGKTLKSNTIDIEVLEKRQLTTKSGLSEEQQFFVVAEPSTTTAYVGQQIIVDYKLYTVVNIDSYHIMNESDYAGCYVEELKRFNASPIQEVKDGVQYISKVLKRVALFPQQIGKIEISPMEVQIGIAVPNPRGGNGFFFNRRLQRQAIYTTPITINCPPLPNNAPDSFSGAIGNYNVKAILADNGITTDDAVSLTLDITGTGDLKRIQPPQLDFPNQFEVYDPKVKEEISVEQQGQVVSRKVIEYLAIPKQAGNYKLIPAFTYFSPDSADYITIRPDTFSVVVHQGSANKDATIITNETRQTEESIRYIINQPTVSKKTTPFWGSTLFWILNGLPFLLLGGILIYKQQLNKRGTIDTKVIRHNQAQQIALKHLVQAKTYSTGDNSRAFYNEVSKAIMGYVSDKLQIPNSELSKHNIRKKLQSLQVSNTNIEAFVTLIQTCEMALFGGMNKQADRVTTYEKAVEVLSAIESEIKN